MRGRPPGGPTCRPRRRAPPHRKAGRAPPAPRRPGPPLRVRAPPAETRRPVGHRPRLPRAPPPLPHRASPRRPPLSPRRRATLVRPTTTGRAGAGDRSGPGRQGGHGPVRCRLRAGVCLAGGLTRFRPVGGPRDRHVPGGRGCGGPPPCGPVSGGRASASLPGGPGRVVFRVGAVLSGAASVGAGVRWAGFGPALPGGTGVAVPGGRGCGGPPPCGPVSGGRAAASLPGGPGGGRVPGGRGSVRCCLHGGRCPVGGLRPRAAGRPRDCRVPGGRGRGGPPSCGPVSGGWTDPVPPAGRPGGRRVPGGRGCGGPPGRPGGPARRSRAAGTPPVRMTPPVGPCRTVTLPAEARPCPAGVPVLTMRMTTLWAAGAIRPPDAALRGPP